MGQQGEKLIRQIYVTLLSFVSIFFLTFFVLMQYYINNPKGETDYNSYGIFDLIQLGLNPCNFDEDEKNPCSINDYIKNYCSDLKPDELDFFQYIMFILNGAYVLCTNYNDSVMNMLGSGVYNLVDTPNAPQGDGIDEKITLDSILPKITKFMFVFVLYYIIYSLTLLVKLGFVEAFFVRLFVKYFNTLIQYDLVLSVISVLMLAFTLLGILNVGSYVTYLFWGALSSDSNKLMYVVMLIMIPFVFWMADINLTTVEGATNRRRGKAFDRKGNANTNADGNTSKCTSYGYLVPIIIIFIIPFIVTIRTFFRLVFLGLGGIPLVLFSKDKNVWPKIKWNMIYSFGSFCIATIIIIADKLYKISKL